MAGMKRPVAEILDAVRARLAQSGMPDADARSVAEHLVEADLWGRTGHGVNARLRSMVARLQERGNGAAPWGLAVDRGSAVRLDGQGAEGYLLLVRAADLAVERARAHGLALVGVSNTTHTGMLGFATFRIASAGFVGLAFTHCCPLMAPTGGAAKLLGTNPFSAAFPHAPEPIVIDLSPAAITYGEVGMRRERGEVLPPGVAVDAEGEPTTDPAAALAGALLPVAGGKGTALAVAVQLLAGALTGAAAIPRPQVDYGLLCLAIAPDILRGDGGYADAVREFVDAFKRVPPAAGQPPPRLPGAAALSRRAQGLREGLEVDDDLWQFLQGKT